MDWKKCREEGIVSEARPRERVIASLRHSAENKRLSQEQLPLTPITAASKFTLAYDSLRELLEALALRCGYKIYNHGCYVAFLSEILHERILAARFDALRRMRNKVNYYGKDLSVQQAKRLLAAVEELRLAAEELLEAPHS